MSRIGKLPIKVPPEVRVDIQGNQVTVTGPRGELRRSLHPDLVVRLDGDKLLVSRPSDQRQHRAAHGLSRTLLANMIEGVSQGFEKVLELSGVGYRAQQTDGKLIITVGYSHPVEIVPPPGISLVVEGTNRIRVQGIDKELVGETAARIRKVRIPDPYRVKGIKYLGEEIRRKPGKAGKAGGKGR
ncbi:MAG TPA: 50S ribosomal protein L6 [Dehalococcoidia bacterium]|nr:50S ribosomal protein L6 [Dehalococcoidia bacterium]